jgi:hypothetical protein
MTSGDTKLLVTVLLGITPERRALDSFDGSVVVFANLIGDSN